MNSKQLAAVVAKVQLGDNRDVDDIVLDEWEDIIGHLDFDDAIEAVRMHRRESTAYLVPAHIVANVRLIQSRQQRAERVVAARERAALPKPAELPLDRDEHDRVFRESLRAARIARGVDPDTGKPTNTP